MGVTIAKHAGLLKALAGQLQCLEKEIGDLERQLEFGSDMTVKSSINAKIGELQEVAQSEVTPLGKYAVA
ncbi:hypothetical protein NDU88_011005 [Pleurodeles waltl]|uniref:Uncharacterized protein n=1 Tax=Pleurodeles waltl TaxID=8319 RepID=A0AAV7PWG6_PLEWA|nr:hypothetical protein NDU88_011005 [Pleurodeles waltl]